MGEREECVGKQWGRSFLGNGRSGPHIRILLLNFPEEDNIPFFLLLLEPWSKHTRNEGPWLPSCWATASPRACLLERQRTNFLFLFLPIWDNLRRNSIIFIPFSFPASAGRTIYNSIKSQISIPTRDFNPLSPNKSTAHLITESPHGEICDLKKTLIPTFYFMVERSRCEWEVSSHLPLTVFSVYKDFLKVYDITFNPSNKYTAKRSQDTLISCSGTKHLKNLHEIWTFKSKSSKIKIHLILNMSYHINK